MERMEQIVVFLRKAEKDALLKLAVLENRDPRHQAGQIIRLELLRRGLLDPQPETQPAPEVVHAPHQSS